MEKPNNRSSVLHTVHAEGYRYDVFKGELKKGSFISKSEHPTPEVEEFKKKLFARKVLKDAGTHWVLKKNIRTGHLMAVNLHAGRKMKDSPYKQDIIVSSAEAAQLDGQLPEKSICVTDSDIVMKSICDTLRFSSVNIMEVDEEVFVHHGSDTFGRDEAFAMKILREKGVLSSSVRHGIPAQNEADIVDEIAKEQYEITYEFKTDLPKKLMKPDIVYSPEILTMQLVDSPYIHTSKSLAKKLKKEYTKQYRSNLVILTLASKESTIVMLEALAEKIKKEHADGIRFSKIYIISLDFINEQAIFSKISSVEPFATESFPCKNDELGFIKITPIKFADIEDTGKYLMVCDNIFDGVQRLRFDEGSALKNWAKEVRIWGV